MAQIFRPGSNTYSKVSIVAIVLFVTGLFFLLGFIERSPYKTEEGVTRAQPVPFSHQHHVAGMGIDCRYCHFTVERAAFAGIPPVAVCMNCHSQIWADSPTLAPIRNALKTGLPISWTRVHALPDFVYFNHSIHLHKGIGCVSCHGRVDQMPFMWKAHSLNMEWCLECHRNPARHLRPRDKVFDMDWVPTESQATLGARLMKEYRIRQNLTDCTVCHR